MFSNLFFDPTKVDLTYDDSFQGAITADDDGNEKELPSGIRAHIEDRNAMSGGYRCRQFRPYIMQSEIQQIAENCPLTAQEVYTVTIQLLVRAAMCIEGFDEFSAKTTISILIEPNQSEIVRGIIPESEKTKVVEQVLKLASDLYKRVDTELYIESMRLNMEDFQKVFTNASCVHDRNLVIKRLKNPGCKITDAERNQHLTKNRAMSFSTLASMSMFDVLDKVFDPGQVTLQNAGRY
ncbi:MAG: hypothetical protein WCG31_10855, partial [Deltaproteobacteria bacterium]